MDISVESAVAWCARVLVWLVTIVPTECNSPAGPGLTVNFELSSNQGAALVTSHPTCREDVEDLYSFEIYIKKYYDSWVDFARERGRGRDIKPILVTGVDLTKEFATIAYSDNRTLIHCGFKAGTTGTSASVSLWGEWIAPEGLVHRNCGPTSVGRSQGDHDVDETSFPETHISEDNNQCVFIRYYTIRKRFFIPLALYAGAGPHRLQVSDDDPERDDEEMAVDVNSDLDGDLEETASASNAIVHNVPLVSPQLHLLTTKSYS